MTGQLNSNGIAPIDDEDDFKFEDLGDGMAIVTYPVDRGACDDRYCPYCNSCPLDGVTDEHVYPQSIGGDGRTVIGVCKRCNNKAGANVDVWVSRQSWLKSLAFRSGNLMKRHEEHESTAKLKDGRMLVGHFYWINVGKNAARPAFQPLKTQPDGSKWITEHACQDSAKLPADINVYREDMLDKASFKLQLPEGAGLESAMIKILLGMSYWGRGVEAIMLPGFDVMRNCLKGEMDPRVTVSWIDSLETLNKKELPCEVMINNHTVWGECADGQTFIGGVSLFGRIIAEIIINGFGAVLPGRMCSTENPWVPNRTT